MGNAKIGLALGAGGARGMAHIGVLKVLEERGIRPHCIAGSSMGSLVGVLYANDLNLSLLERLAIQLRRKHWLDMTVPKLGFVAGEKVKQLVRLLTHGKNLEDLSLPVAVVATDLERGERVVFRTGPIDQAVRASMSIPGIFVPERIDGRLYVDGAVTDRLPVDVVRDMGADFIIAVDVTPFQLSTRIQSIFDVIAQTIDILEKEVNQSRVLHADVVIRPDVGRFSSTAFTNIAEIIAEGEKAARAMIDEIEEKLRRWEGTR
nr:patatin-like phospholipase family protein [Calditerricola satsumensis]